MLQLNYFLLLFLFLIAHVFGEDPWGKDSELSGRPKHLILIDKHSKNIDSSKSSLSATLIHFHQDVISPADGPRSHFIPSSSQYTLEAMQTYGFYEGFLLGCDRLMRENTDEWVYRRALDPSGNLTKYDPVP